MIKNDLRPVILKWLNDNPAIFLYEEVLNGIRLVEIDTRKQKDIVFAQVAQWRETVHPEGLGTYLNLIFEDGTELVLCYQGFAFSPSDQTTGPIADLPPVVCFQDLRRLLNHAAHMVPPKTDQEKFEAVKVLMVSLAILEGARLLAFDIDAEEKEAEKILEVLEKG